MEKKLRELVAKWRKEALAMVPPEYADRNMHGKYLRLDNHAAGLDEAADELEEFLADAGGEPRVSPLSEEQVEKVLRETRYNEGHGTCKDVANALNAALLGSDGKVEK